MKTYPRIKALVFALSLTGLAACASPPEPPQPSGERVPVNQPQQVQQQQPVAQPVTAPADDLQLINRRQDEEPVLLTSPRPADDDLPRLNYRK